MVASSMLLTLSFIDQEVLLVVLGLLANVALRFPACIVGCDLLWASGFRGKHDVFVVMLQQCCCANIVGVLTRCDPSLLRQLG